MQICFTNDTDDPRRKDLVKGLVRYNDSVGPLENWEWVAFYAQEEDGRLIGGLHGQLEWDYLFVKHLWVAQQRQGLGGQLLQKAENLARERNKKGAWVDTFEFQAREFYEKQGYKVFGEIPRAAGNHKRYFLIKLFE